MINLGHNINDIVGEMKSLGNTFLSEVDKAVFEAAKEYMKDCIIEIDALIYSQPASPYYPKRTKFLRRSHHIRRLTQGVFLIFNDASYAEYQHDGWDGHAGRPWMQNPLDRNANKYRDIIADKVGGGLFT